MLQTKAYLKKHEPKFNAVDIFFNLAWNSAFFCSYVDRCLDTKIRDVYVCEVVFFSLYTRTTTQMREKNVSKKQLSKIALKRSDD